MKQRVWRSNREALVEGDPPGIMSQLCLPHLVIYSTSSMRLLTTTTSLTGSLPQTPHRCSSWANQRQTSYINVPCQCSTPANVYHATSISDTPPTDVQHATLIAYTLALFDHSDGAHPNGAPPQPRLTHSTGVQLNCTCTKFFTNSFSWLQTSRWRAWSLLWERKCKHTQI